jgi:membrane-associated phospholipid phosphatase
MTPIPVTVKSAVASVRHALSGFVIPAKDNLDDEYNFPSGHMAGQPRT